ncbi:hypothetical protein ACFU6S_32635 [Streptomyces sp. NPDC057456]|uniref:hypothetical protein n=1 Tax=Streptomyces sp. NPDC057456 TaxID=3346139 RepID=UPI0036B57616
MFGPYRYSCPIHGESDPYSFRSQADKFGAEHRREHHGNMHPPGGECILTSGEWRAPQGGERTAVVVFAVVILVAFISRFI